MKVVIDASNLRGGGGLTHLLSLRTAASPERHRISAETSVADAAHAMCAAGLPIAMEFVRPSDDRPSEQALTARLAKYEPNGRYMDLRGGLAHADVAQCYQRAEAFVYGSSSENRPNILIEAMASGLPIANSSRGPMPEVPGDAGVYFDAEDPAALALQLRALVDSAELRSTLAQRAFDRAARYSWNHCAEQTFACLASVLNDPDAGRTR